MSLSLARKSLRLIENDSKPKVKKAIEPKAINKKRKVQKDDQETKVRKLLLLNASTVNDATAETVNIMNILRKKIGNYSDNLIFCSF